MLVAPSDEEVEVYETRKVSYDERRAQMRKLIHEPTLSSDDHRVELAANIGSVEDLQKFLPMAPKGSGYSGLNSFIWGAARCLVKKSSFRFINTYWSE